ncbi:sigma-70 family RNA polymerase sigma factor [Micromonospora sp. NPDC050397]|uniref:sigma-70 family RNA polymerase sigma factor n=1 Tax=Micromonospora sp. NPDC050397 TaxID=3364279 RepID=UPI0038514DF5
MTRVRSGGAIPPNLSRRQAGGYVIEAVLSALDMRPAELSRLTGHASVTISRYRAGKRVPTKVFLLDLLDKAPNAGLTFDQIAPKLGHFWNGSRDPGRYRSFADYFAAIRILERRSRDQFAIKLGLAIEEVREMEHGVLPDEVVIRKFVRTFLRPEYSRKHVIAAFPQLRPDAWEQELRERFLKFQHLPKNDPTRRAMENAIIEDCIPMAKGIANAVAWRYRRRELAEEIWGEGVVRAVRDHDPRRGYLPGYLKARIEGLARGILWSRRQTGVNTSTVLCDYSLMVREAEEFLLQDFGRSPSEAEIAQYLDVPAEVVREVSQALLVSDTVLTDNLELLLQDVAEMSIASQLWVENDDPLIGRFRRLAAEEKELLYLYYFDQFPKSEIALAVDLSEVEVSSGLKWALARLCSEVE